MFAGLAALALTPAARPANLPAATPPLRLELATFTTVAAPGDFVRYTLTLENPASAATATDVVILDRLPPGTRYQYGTTTVNGAPAGDPRYAPGPDNLRFRLAALEAGRRVTIEYVVEVVGGAAGGELVNRATAEGAGGLSSNEATATLRLAEDLFDPAGTIVGRVVEGDCREDVIADERGVADVRIYLEDGSHAVTDESGRFHFDAVAPGTHVAQLDPWTLPPDFDAVGCTETPGFAGRADSQFVKLQRGGLLRADFYVRRKPAREGRIDLELQSRGGENADRVRYDLVVNGKGGVPIANILLTVTLPAGVRYVPGSLAVDGESAGEPEITGDVLSLRLPDRSGDWSVSVQFEAAIDATVSGERTTRASARFDSPAKAGQVTPVAETKMLRDPATTENAGYVLDLKFGILSDRLSAEDEQELDELVAAWRGMHDVRLSVVGHSDSQPIAARNRHLFQDNYALSEARARAAATYVARALGLESRAMQVTGRGPDEPVADNATVEGRARNRRVEMVLSGVRPGKPSFLAVSPPTSGTLHAQTPGAPPGTEAPGRAPVAASQGGGASERVPRHVEEPVRAEVLAADSVLLADGQAPPVIALRLFDRRGLPVPQGTVGRYRVEPPYRALSEAGDGRPNPLSRTAVDGPAYRVDEDGIARIELEPTTRTGKAQVTLVFGDRREQTLDAWLAPVSREWLLVGFAEGTAGYNVLSENEVAAAEAGIEEDYYDEGRVAFFAKGQVLGEYLLTLAYDTDRDYDAERDTFETMIDPNRYYPLYGDASVRRFEAPSQRKIYVKLERDQFYALFGDFATGLDVTDLSRYERQLNGLKSAFRGEHAGYDAFAAESNQAFRRDELRGDGTSGLYYLDSVPIIVNSEEIRIEVRDRFDSGVVLESQTLTRHLDYRLDPLDGSLYFRRPVASRDLDFNPVYIVAEYETLATAADDFVAGGRASVYASDRDLEFGVTHINDRASGAEGELTGVDFRWQVDAQTRLTAEIAASSTPGGGDTDGSAHSFKLEHNGEAVDLRIFMREVDDEFGLGYQSEADRGVRRLGFDARAELRDHWYLDGEIGWQQRIDTRDVRNLARAQLRYDRDTWAATLALTHAEDRFDDGDASQSELAELGLAKEILDGRVTLRASTSTTLNDEAESLDYPARTVFAADYHLNRRVDLVAEYEEAHGRDIRATMSRFGVRALPWTRARMDTSIGHAVTEYGPRLFANLGLVQGIQLSERWQVDIGFDQTDTLTGNNARQFDPDRELASGSTMLDDFLAVHTGASYTADAWTANSRIEFRNSDREERTALFAGWYREPRRGHGLSAGLTLFRAVPDAGGELASANLRFGWAWRPDDSAWTMLDRLDLGYDNFESGAARERGYRIVNNFTANRRFGAAMQLALQYASKYVRTEFPASTTRGYSDLTGFDLRRGFGGQWDAGIGLSLYHAWESDVFDYGLGIDAGYKLATNVWLTLGYNLTGFHDDDFVTARYTAQGPFVRFTMKADQHLLEAIAGQRGQAQAE